MMDVVAPSLTPDDLQLVQPRINMFFSCSSLSHPG